MNSGRRFLQRVRGIASAEWAGYTLIAVLSVAYYLSYYNAFLNLSDEGFLVNGAVRVLDGQVPLSDFYAYAPGRYYLLASLFVLFGVNLATERLMWVGLMALRNILVFSVSRRLMSPAISLAVALTVMLVPGPWYSTFGSLLIFLHLEVLFRYVERPALERAARCGIVAGVAMYFRGEYLIYSLVAGLVAVLVANFLHGGSSQHSAADGGLRPRVLTSARHIGVTVVAAALCTVPMLLFYGLRGELEVVARRLGPSALAIVDVTYDAFPFPPPSTLVRHFYELFRYWPRSFHVWFANSLCAYVTVLVMVVGIGLACYQIAERLGTRDADTRGTGFLVVLLAWAAFVELRVIHLPLFVYFLIVSQPVVVIGAVLLATILGQLTRAWAPSPRHSGVSNFGLGHAVRAVLGLILASILVFSWSSLMLYGLRCDVCGTIGSRKADSERLHTARADIILGADEASEIQGIITEVTERATPGETIFAFRQAMFYFLTERKNATTLDWITAVVSSEQEALDLIAHFRDHPPTLQIVHADSWLVYLLSECPCEVQEVLFDDYDIAARSPNYIILVRRPGSDGWTALQSELAARGLELTKAPGCE
jgi:hypothetical protein